MRNMHELETEGQRRDGQASLRHLHAGQALGVPASAADMPAATDGAARGDRSPAEVAQSNLIVERIYSRCVECGDCLIWKGGRGIPEIRINGVLRNARRWLWEALHGQIPENRFMTYTCESPDCMLHIAPVTWSKLQKRTAATGAMAHPARRAKIAAASRNRSSLTLEQVAEIRRGADPLQAVADRYGISKSTAGNIRRGESWKDYSNPFAGLGA